VVQAQSWAFDGTHGTVAVRDWPNPEARYLAVLVHGYGEHIARYDHVADTLVRHGATVAGPDHLGHGRSAGERVLVDDFADVVTDLHTAIRRLRQAHPDLPLVLIGHSMGGMLAARYAQLHPDEPAVVVLSGPVLGSWPPIALADLDEIPDEPLDTTTLSRDPEVGRAYAADPLVWHGPYRRPTLRAFARCLARIEAGGRLDACPVLWIHGGADELVPIEGTRSGVAAIRGADFTEVRYPGAHHEVFNETNRTEVLADVTTFVDRALHGTGSSSRPV